MKNKLNWDQIKQIYGEWDCTSIFFAKKQLGTISNDQWKAIQIIVEDQLNGK